MFILKIRVSENVLYPINAFTDKIAVIKFSSEVCFIDQHICKYDAKRKTDLFLNTNVELEIAAAIFWGVESFVLVLIE